MSYKSISWNEFRSFVFDELEEYFEIDTVGGERAFKYHMGNDFYVYILTSIPLDEQYTRKKNDAIRVHLRDPEDNFVQAESHTKRTKGYQKRISEKVSSITNCPESECSGHRKIADGPYGYYFFCPEDSCEYQESVD